MKKVISFLTAVLIASTVSSCYKIIRTEAPTEVVPGETFVVTMTVADDGDTHQKFVNDWSMAGLRVPEGWKVALPALPLRAFAEDWVYLEDGSKADMRYAMAGNEKVTAVYNEACPKDGYKWFGFQTRTKVPKFLAACWRNGSDSIRIAFKVTVPADCKGGVYTLDFIGGDEEDDRGIGKYSKTADAKGTRVFHVGTFNHSYIEHEFTAMARQVTVVADPAGISSVNAGEREKRVYSIDGKHLEAPAKGVNIIDGKKRIVR